MKWYAVRRGERGSVFATWPECEAAVKGVSGVRYKSFATRADADAFAAGTPVQAPAASTADRDPAGPLVVYTDGACPANGTGEARAGYGVFFGRDDPRNVSRALEGRVQTNNRAELMGAIAALEALDPGTAVEIRTDSTYVCLGYTTWMAGWVRRGWAGVKNRDLWERLVTAAERVGRSKITFTHIRGHAGIPGNEAADALAVAATRPRAQ